MTNPSDPKIEQIPRRWPRRLSLLGLGLVVVIGFLASTDPTVKLRERKESAFRPWSKEVTTTAAEIDQAMEVAIAASALKKAEAADWATVCRRISLGLVGCSMSLEEYRAIEGYSVAGIVPNSRLASRPKADGIEGGANASDADQKITWWTDYLLSDPRWSQYFSERFARAFVGTNQGPFLVYRRHRFEVWLAEAIAKGTPYDKIVRDMITAEGLWTGNPEVNFLTAAVTKEGGRHVDPIVLAGRTTRAFLGMRIDCLQCHDDLLDKVKFGGPDDPITGKQIDFHRLASFYGASAISKNPILGVKDSRDKYRTTLLGDSNETVIAPSVPFAKELQPKRGSPREQLAQWITHRENKAFARATVNRVWAHLFGKPMIEPVDDIPLHGPFPPGFEKLADHFIESDYDLRSLVRTIVATKAFQRDSRLDDEAVTESHEKTWAVFPLTPLRPEQVAASLHQACRLRMIDNDSSLLSRLERYGTLIDFRKAYGDRGEDEFIAQGITIPQRLLVMNGKFIRERIDNNPVVNAGTQIGFLASSNRQVVEASYLAALNRHPTTEEQKSFEDELSKTRNRSRERAIGDMFWVLLNSTEFAWNH